MRVDGKDSAALAQGDVAARVLAAQAGDASTPVVISADRGVKYEVVVRTMDGLQRAGVQRVGLSVEAGRQMTAAALSHDAFAPEQPPGMRSGLVLAILAHVLLVAALAWSVNWKTSEPEGVVAELWSAMPQIAAPRPTPPPEPRPPVVEVKQPQPAPRPEPVVAPRGRRADRHRAGAREGAPRRKPIVSRPPARPSSRAAWRRARKRPSATSSGSPTSRPRRRSWPTRPGRTKRSRRRPARPTCAA